MSCYCLAGLCNKPAAYVCLKHPHDPNSIAPGGIFCYEHRNHKQAMTWMITVKQFEEMTRQAREESEAAQHH